MAAVALSVQGSSLEEQNSSIKDVPENRTWFGQRGKRTKAMPKNTLFGGTLEIYKNDDKKQIQTIDIEQFQKDIEHQRKLRQTRYETKLPHYLRIHGKKEADLKQSQEAVTNKLKEHKRAKKILDVLETNSKFFNVGVCEDKHSTSSSEYRDVENINNNVNSVGFQGSSTVNYNRDKYEKKPDSHQYALLGDPLRQGMDFAEPEIFGADGTKQMQQLHRAKNPNWLPREAYIPKYEKDPRIMHVSVDVPPNILHKYGTEICADVLGNQMKVNKTLQEEEDHKKRLYRLNTGRPKYVLPTSPADPLYEGLGQTLRKNIFPGYSFNHFTSVKQSDYTDRQFKERLPIPDKYRYMHDAQSRWAEANIIRDNMKKLWIKHDEEIKAKKAG